MNNMKSMNKCLMLPNGEKQNDLALHSLRGRLFECKTCSRKFLSFQALGGHRASHKKPRLMLGEDVYRDKENQSLLKLKPKAHECLICGLEFPIGQALGGHMRRHRIETNEARTTLDRFPLSHKVPTLKKANSRRILCLDLNLSPLENDLNLEMRSGTGFTEMSSPPKLNQYL
ncbi:hypothetical protein IFM89_033666 [Coptis chinensis]|uniref:C2H2-type domain-containing protein n=1 Tax=Coptis chinensis TaxID=261450 RepID=A0A835HIP8_9MAGN|nr:hypothetical protein IFM89_033666 [Coptis chinensis]